jgi:hypothetical protein
MFQGKEDRMILQLATMDRDNQAGRTPSERQAYELSGATTGAAYSYHGDYSATLHGRTTSDWYIFDTIGLKPWFLGLTDEEWETYEDFPRAQGKNNSDDGAVEAKPSITSSGGESATASADEMSDDIRVERRRGRPSGNPNDAVLVDRDEAVRPAMSMDYTLAVTWVHPRFDFMPTVSDPVTRMDFRPAVRPDFQG